MASIEVKTWGRRGLGTITVRVQEGETAEEALSRSVARRTGLTVVTCRADGTALNRGKPEAKHYQLTLGRPLSKKLGGGYAGEGELWAAIPVEG